MIRKTLAAVLGTAGLLFWASSAGAVTVSVAFQEDNVLGGAVTPQGSATDAALILNNPYGGWTVNLVTAQGTPPGVEPNLLFSTSQNTYNPTGTFENSTLTIYVTATDIISPTGSLEFTTGLTSNLLAAGWTVDMAAWLDPDNGEFNLGLDTLLHSNSFAAAGVSNFTGFENAGVGPYSITHVYVLTATSRGQAQSTISVSAVPIPAALPLFGAALLGLGAFARFRRRNQVAA